MIKTTIMLTLLLVSESVAAENQVVDPEAIISEVTGAIGVLDGPRVEQLLNAHPASAFNTKDTVLRNCILQRLNRQKTVDIPEQIDSPTIRQIFRSYMMYWRASMNDSSGIAAYHDILVQNLQKAVNRPDLATIEEIEPILQELLSEAGYHSLQGRTGQLRELMVWTEQTERTYKVTLPEGIQDTRVMMMDNFISFGWYGYHSCERSKTGGWATKDMIHLVVPAYINLDDERFKVSFLAHEAQHFLDKNRFTDLEGWEWEYRAKLVELALANATREKLLKRFSKSQSDNPKSTHGYANRRVLLAIRDQLKLNSDADLLGVPVDRLQNAALATLKADTEHRKVP
ncbi:hypothetical protein [Parasphingorhabdus cellanae]|uniref:DUF2268 domain-containing protein n=1 Tax=Parasphingorhabdus cellanae TaxID=2806553 RepID=A0ABX7T076_9SPHN|nr:hypothetical protein [Parasphingorhabdus cellanae]QTD54936.1 hypothetical protein J4G78_11870 [Parasphingorhabdus cellanae]